MRKMWVNPNWYRHCNTKQDHCCIFFLILYSPSLIYILFIGLIYCLLAWIGCYGCMVQSYWLKAHTEGAAMQCGYDGVEPVLHLNSPDIIAATRTSHNEDPHCIPLPPLNTSPNSLNYDQMRAF
ncbi:hypothetical protein GOODEAATRI_015605 [Goodea atripinnis]|uniref:Uncharacterized protein n=1 Tax=Goodea atripinnis TaxID=208336 RepID=A0ABV0NXG4_9TELE